MANTPTITECRNAMVEKCQATRISASFDNAEGSGNITDVVKYRFPADLTTPLTGGAISGTTIRYLSFIKPTAADYPTANIGDMCQVLYVNSGTSTTAPTGSELFIYTTTGWERFATSGIPQMERLETVTDIADTAPTLTAAQVFGGIIVGTPTTARTATLPTAASLWALCSNPKVGTSIHFSVENAAAATNAITIGAVASITNGGHANNLIVAASTSKAFKIVFTSATAAVIYSV